MPKRFFNGYDKMKKDNSNYKDLYYESKGKKERRIFNKKRLIILLVVLLIAVFIVMQIPEVLEQKDFWQNFG